MVDKYIDEVKGVFDELDLSNKNSETSLPAMEVKEYGRLIETGDDSTKAEWLSTAHSVPFLSKS